MSSPRYDQIERDREFFRRELEGFVPDRLFDAHVHLGRRDDYPPLHTHLVGRTPELTDAAIYRAHLDMLTPGREIVGAVVITSALGGNGLEEGNRFAARQARKVAATSYGQKRPCGWAPTWYVRPC